MSDLDERHLLLRQQAREWAAQLRPYALAVDYDPTLVTTLVELPAFACAARGQIPAAYHPAPLTIKGERFYLTSAAERAVFCEEMARADLGLMLGMPGASMCGVLVDVIGDHAQKEWFYGRLLERPTWTFFALTEPQGGSDAGGLRTRAVAGPADSLTLHGVKRYVSNALRARLGVVFCRTGPGPLELAAALVEAPAPGLRVEAVDTLGVRGAQLGQINLDAAAVPPERLLGRRLSPVRRGAWGWQRTFNLLRPTVAAMAVGLAQAAHDYARAHRRALSGSERDRLDRLDRGITATRRLTRQAALAVDHDPDAGQLASAAKQRAARLAEEVTRRALEFFGPGARLEHPLLDKFARDARGLEFMEGSGDIQRLNLFTALRKGTLDAALHHVGGETACPPRT